MATFAPYSIVAKNLSTSHDRDIFAGILIGDEILCHVSLGPRSRQSKTAAPVTEDHLRRRVVWGNALAPQVLTGRGLGGGLTSRSLGRSA
jgi:hypothetical protein